MTAPTLTPGTPVDALWTGKRSKAQTQAWSRLRGNGIHTVGRLRARSAVELLAIDGFGAVCLAEVERALHAHGLSLKDGSERGAA